jgi:thioredoxin reductase (NADPH)
MKEYRSKTLIFAFGKTPRTLDVVGEKEFRGKGVSYCAICDGPLFSNKVVAVIGGGNSALYTTLYLSKIATKVYLIHRRNEFRAFEDLVDNARKKSNVEFILKSVVKEIKDGKLVDSLVVENVDTKEVKELKLQGVFVEIGSEVKSDFIKNFVKLDENGQIIINEKCETFYPNSEETKPGVFAAGDVTNTPFKQIVVAAGEGCKAALQACNYLQLCIKKG